MQHFRIEKGIKVPAIAQAISNGKPSMAVATMAVLKKSESFLIKDPLEAVKAEKRMRDLNARQRENDGGRAYVSRKVGVGVRIWRVK